MKISKNTPDLLVVDDRPWFSGLLLIGFVLIFGGSGVAMLLDGLFGGIFMLAIAGLIFTGFVFLVERTQLIMDRQSGEFEIRKKSMRRMKRERHALKDLRRTTVEAKTSHSNGSVKVMSRIILVFADGNGETGTPLTAALSTGGAAEEISPIINAWLEAAKS